MIRTWIKNLCNAIDNLDVSNSTDNKKPIINGKSIECWQYFNDYNMFIYNNNHNVIATININEAEHSLLNDSINEFQNRVNESRITEFLKPFI